MGLYIFGAYSLCILFGLRNLSNLMCAQFIIIIIIMKWLVMTHSLTHERERERKAAAMLVITLSIK